MKLVSIFIDGKLTDFAQENTSKPTLLEITSYHFESTTEVYEGLSCIFKETTDGFACEVSYSNVRLTTDVSKIDGEEPEEIVKFIYARESRLELIPEIIFDQFQELSKMDLRNVHMLQLKPFKRCSFLSCLNLEDNEIKDLDGKIFEKCPNLLEIYLSGNGIRYMSTSAFDGLEKLETLHIRNSNLKIVGSDHWRLSLNRAAFRDLNELVDLEISLIRALDFGSSLQGKNNLEVIRLDLNVLLEITDETFHSLWKIKELNLRTNQISIINENAFLSLTMLASLDLSDNKLIHFPASLQYLKVIELINLDKNEIKFLNQLIDFPRLETFSISNNQVESINLKFFSFQLKSLLLSGNVCIDKNFKQIQSFELEVQPELKNCYDHFVKETFCLFRESPLGYSCKLILDHETEEIDEDERSHFEGKTDADVKYAFLKFEPLNVGLNIILEKFKELEKIELWDSSIDVLHPINFCSELKSVDFRINNIAELMSDSFSSCSQLQTLILAKNKISTLDPKAFDGLNNLILLDLSFNDINSIPVSLFDQSIKVKTLRINHNKLSSLSWLSSLSALNVLSLTSNEIEILNFKDLEPLGSLQELYLDKNKIIEIQFEDEYISNLYYLNLDANKLSVLNLNGISFPKLQYLDISNNEIHSIKYDMRAFRFLQDLKANGNVCVNESFDMIDDFDEKAVLIMQNC